MEEARELVERLRQAVDNHDVDAVVECFTANYRNETPAHPTRGFQGADQVRINWERIFASVRNITAEVFRTAVDGDAVWSEWEMRGTRSDGQPHLMRGVIIFGVNDRHAEWARFYLETVDASEGGVDAAISAIVEPKEPS